MTTCTLCDLPTPDPPVTDESHDPGDPDHVAGEYCCRGCLAVARALGPDADPEAADLDEELGEAPTDRDVPDDAATAFLRVDGMHCATCERFVESTAREDAAVHDVAASYATDLVRLRYDPDRTDPGALAERLTGYGYTASEASAGGPRTEDGDELVSFLVGGGFFGMMVMVWYVLFLYPTYLGYTSFVDLGGLDGQYLLWNVWVFASIVLFYTGFPVLRGAVVSLRAGQPNMDLLVALAATSAYVYSTLAIPLGRTHVYFDVTVAVVLVVTLGTYYETRMKRRAVGGLADLTTSRVGEATLFDPDGEGRTVPVETLSPGDRVLVAPGERVPVDGTVVSGTAAVDEALVTGESLPRTRREGDGVLGGTVVTDAPLVVAVGEDATSTLDRLVDRLWAIQSGRSGVQRLADRLATVFVPLVLVLGVVATVAHLLLGAAPAAAVLTGLTVLVVSCPCALGLATPLAVARGIETAANRGVVVSGETLFEDAPDVETVVFDKTGTLTDGRMRVVDRLAVGDRDPGGVTALAARVERYSRHPVAEAVVEAAAGDGGVADDAEDGGGAAGTPPTATDGGVVDEERTGSVAEDGSGAGTEVVDDGVSDAASHPRGVSALVEGREVVVGHPALLRERGYDVPAAVESRVESAREAGAVPVLVGHDGDVVGLLVVGDDPREEWDRVVGRVAGDGRRVVVLTGDDERATARFREHPDVAEVFAGVPPAGKAETVRRLRASGPVAMVGDGSNDAPALAEADVGIALASGTDLATEAADAVVVDRGLDAVPEVLALATATHGRIRTNLGWAFCYNAVAVPLAATGLLNPLFAALAMGASSLLVVANSSRSLGVEEE
jgi:Cu2+-exporting ATPase